MFTNGCHKVRERKKILKREGLGMEEIMGPQMYWGGWTKEGGGQDTFPLPTSQNIPKQTVCPLSCYQGKFVYIHTEV